MSIMTQKILLIDNDQELTKMLSNHLAHDGYETMIAEDGELGLKLALNHSLDAIILEVLLPKKNGFSLVQTLRAHKSTPILFLTAQDSEIDKLMGIEFGGDDYLIKPCCPHELLARLRSLVRRGQNLPKTPRQMAFENIHIDCNKHQVTLNSQLLELTNTEFKILEILSQSPGQAFSKEELTEYALNRKFTAFDRSIDVHISNLRQKLGKNTSNESWIKTVRGFGYSFNLSNKE